MFDIVFALFLFMASVIAHLFFCRNTPKRGLHAKAFGLMAILSFGIYLAGVLLLPYSGKLDTSSLWGGPFRITAGVIFISLVPIYLIFYVLTQLTSPSKKILLTIAQRNEVSYRDILASIEEENFIMMRLSDLCTSGCVMEQGGRYVLTPEGQKIAATLDFMQFILGRKTGG